jgi:hypothetical protein
MAMLHVMSAFVAAMLSVAPLRAADTLAKPVDGLVSAWETRRQLQSLPDCRMSVAAELVAWARAQRAAGQALDEGLYWVRPDDAAAAAYGAYLHLPSERAVEYGNLFFDARLVLTCRARP